MEAIMLEKPFSSPSKNYARNFKKSINRSFSSTPCENLAPMNYHNGILQTPPPTFLYRSFPPFLAHQQQPPLLPLPISNGIQNYNHHMSNLHRVYSCPPINRKVNKNSKKSKSFTSSPKKEESPKPSKVKVTNMPSSKVVMVSSTTNPLGPDPKDLPKDVSMVLSLSPTGEKERSGTLSSRYVQSSEKGQIISSYLSPSCENVPGALNSCYMQSSLSSTCEKQSSGALNSRYLQSLNKDRTTLSLSCINKSVDKVNKISGCDEVFTTISPPPSSLPLPTFSLRPKLISCKKEAAGIVDAGATDNLRRLLRL